MLSSEQARAFYDKFGERQDRQGYYENPALQRMLALGSFGSARTVYEFGCGTGRLAEMLLESHLPAGACLIATDISPVMVGLARRRLAPFGDRAQVLLVGPEDPLASSDGVVDRLVSTYVLDLLARDRIGRFLDDAARVVRPGGLMCLVGLTEGRRGLAWGVSRLWRLVQRASPKTVGGCRPLVLGDMVECAAWRVRHRDVVAPWGIASEVIVAERTSGPAATPKGG